jgi:pilus assembly protein Flp/PilA
MINLSRRSIRWAANFLKAEDGPTAVEYAVMLALIIIACIAAITAFGQNTNSTFSFVGSTLAVKK